MRCCFLTLPLLLLLLVVLVVVAMLPSNNPSTSYSTNLQIPPSRNCQCCRSLLRPYSG
jgi:hypothetical protein